MLIAVAEVAVCTADRVVIGILVAGDVAQEAGLTRAVIAAVIFAGATGVRAVLAPNTILSAASRLAQPVREIADLAEALFAVLRRATMVGGDAGAGHDAVFGAGLRLFAEATLVGIDVTAVVAGFVAVVVATDLMQPTFRAAEELARFRVAKQLIALVTGRRLLAEFTCSASAFLARTAALS
jgi:hypothetical protein